MQNSQTIYHEGQYPYPSAPNPYSSPTNPYPMHPNLPWPAGFPGHAFEGAPLSRPIGSVTNEATRIPGGILPSPHLGHTHNQAGSPVDGGEANAPPPTPAKLPTTVRLEVAIHGWSPRPENPFQGASKSVKGSKDTVIPWKIPPMSQTFETLNLSLASFKEAVYLFADKDESSDWESKLSDILRTSEISLLAYINGHERYAKSKNCYLKEDCDVITFFNAVSLVPRKVSGVICKMIEPGQKARASQVVSHCTKSVKFEF